MLREIPSASETVNDVGYTITTAFTFSGRFKEAFCYVVGSKDHVNLGFPQGAALPDPNSRLKGTGKCIGTCASNMKLTSLTRSSRGWFE